MTSLLRKQRSRYPSPPPSSDSGNSSQKFKRPFLSPQRSSRSSDQEYHFYCFPCDSHGIRKEAHAYCESCTEFLCHMCYKHHRKAKTFRKHKLLEKEKMYQVRLRSKSMNDCSGKCPKHPEEIVTWYCRAEFQTGCHICKEEHDRGDCNFECKAQSDIGCDEESAIKELDMLENKADLKVVKASNNRQIAIDGYNKEVDRIKSFRQMLNDHLDTLECSALKEAKEILEEDNRAMDTIINECSAAKEEIQRMREEISKSGARFSRQQNHADLVKTKAVLSQNEKCNSVRRYHFAPDEGMFQYFLGCAGFGEMLVAEEADLSTEPIDESENTDSSVTTLDDDETQTRCEDENENVADTKALGTIKVKSRSDKKHCHITGMSVLSQDEIVIADSHNNCIKMIDTNTKKVIAEVKLSFSPQDLTAIDKNQVAVTLPCAFLSMIQLVSRFGAFKWKTSHSLKANGNCYGITSTDDKLIVTFTGPPKVEILSLQGDVLQTIETLPDGQCLFSQPWYVAISMDNKTIYVSDRGNKSLTSVPLTGSMDDVIQLLKEGGWHFSPEGVAVTDASVLVCDKESDSGNVYGFSVDLTEKGVIYDDHDGLKHPKTICYSPYNQRVFISCHGDKGRSKIFVFKI